MRSGGLLAILGYAIGTAQILFVDWFRSNAAHRRHLRALRSELRRLSGYSTRWNLEHGVVPESDATPNVPTITAGYTRLLQDLDFLKTDTHIDDNTQQGLMDIADGAALLQRYDAAVRQHLDESAAASETASKAKMLERTVEYGKEYDAELDRWRTMVGSALIDVEHRLRLARSWPQLVRLLQAPGKGPNPPSLPPVQRERP